MPILDLGYRPWTGDRTPSWMRWLVIAQTGSKLAWRSPWVKRIVSFGWMPAFFAMGGLFLFEHALTDGGAREALAHFLRRFFQQDQLASYVIADPKSVRLEVWAQVMLAFFRYPQAVVMVILFGMVAPRMISFDLRSKAYLLYFSRPLGPAEYLVGKAAVLWFLLGMLTLVPAVMVYIGGLMLTEDQTAIAKTWILPFRILVAYVLLAVPTSAVALCLSSWTSESRFAAFTWYAIWIFGWVTYGSLTNTFVRSRPASEGFDRLSLLSPYHTLGQLQAWAFGVLPNQNSIWPALIVVASVTVIAIALTYRRIVAQLRV